MLHGDESSECMQLLLRQHFVEQGGSAKPVLSMQLHRNK
jgi:hypothetical protein